MTARELAAALAALPEEDQDRHVVMQDAWFTVVRLTKEDDYPASVEDDIGYAEWRIPRALVMHGYEG